MTNPEVPKPKRLHRRYLLDRSSQVSVIRYVVGAFAGLGLLYAFALFVLIGSDVMQDKTIAESRLILLLVHTAYFVVGGAILVVLVILLTHRFAGPAYVMRKAIESMRQGKYDARLSLRDHDYHKELAQELAHLQRELAERAHDEAAASAPASDDAEVAAARDR